MGFLSIVTMFIGYLLVYAGIANHGRFATTPWLGVLTDAYSDSGSGGAAPGAPGAPPSGTPGAKPKPKPKNGGPSITIKPIPILPGITIPLP